MIDKNTRDYLNEIYFNPKLPTVADIKRRFRDKFVDLNKYSGLGHRDLVDAVWNHPRGYGLIIPRNYKFWDESITVKVKKGEIKLNSPGRFNTFGPELSLNTSNMTQSNAIEINFLPMPAIKEKVRGIDIDVAYRGIGYWGIISKQHRLMPFDLFVLGPIFHKNYGNKIEVKYEDGDVYGVVPSASRDIFYPISLIPTPTEEKNILWTETSGDCGCEDSTFRRMRRKYKVRELGKFLRTHKYRKGDFPWCKQTYALYKEAFEDSQSTDTPILVDIFPEIKEDFISAFFTLHNYTIIAYEDGNYAIKPVKTKINVTLGRAIAYDPEKVFK